MYISKINIATYLPMEFYRFSSSNIEYESPMKSALGIIISSDLVEGRNMSHFALL